MTLVDRYHSLAAECFALAQKISDPDDKARLILMAQAWRDLADRTEAGPKKEKDES